MNKFKIGFVGFGRRGPGMLRTVAKMPDVEVVAVCDLKEDSVTRQNWLKVMPVTFPLVSQITTTFLIWDLTRS